ncbi:MAG TPA: TolC family protein [Pseudomonadota bacterium]|jgi:outer membrane protein TolC|nr:TolC family protein [Pseudomonadota bacterium]
MRSRQLAFSIGLATLALSSSAIAAPPPAADTVHLSLREAIELGLKADPGVVSAKQSRDRADLAVTRSQLDRFSLRVDAFVNEQYRVSNIAGAAPTPTCSTLAPVRSLTGSGNLYIPLQLLASSGGSLGAPSEADCMASGGAYYAGDSLQSGALGQFSLAANLNVPLFSGFRVTATVERAKLLRDAADASMHQSERQIALDVLRAYWSARRLELQLEVSQQSLARFDEATAAVAARVRNGLAPVIDQNRMESRRQNEVSRRADLDGALLEAKAQLGVLLGVSLASSSLSEPSELPPAPPESMESVDQLLTQARSQRPELRAAHANLLAQVQAVRIARSTYYPQIGLSGLLQFSNNPYNPLIGARVANSTANPFTNITGSVFLGSTLSLNLFDTLNTYTAVRDAQLEEKRLLAEERRVGRAIEADVRVLHARLLHLYRMREPLLRSRALARDNLSILERRYRSGDVAVLDLIDAATDLVTQEITLANQAATIAQTWGELYLAAGRLPPASLLAAQDLQGAR